MTNFPVYRKYTNKNTFFKILSENEFEEISQLGNQLVSYHVIAHQYPEQLRIMDMIGCKDDIWCEISKDEYEKTKKLFQQGRA
ncbi:hypothetical protein [Parvicella tangerina]|uniref:Uncharacterized protein n=1 Tax=Parvicella tangerina TaxID=2829795 RepID=A0A916NCH2_9FLAO|nr:hypothetical protein [Parvicella tangerina]CAG5085253.1 hypothetical protein CRYO30217_02701 [Parvicella tangerina]